MGLKNTLLKLIRSVINPLGYDVVKYKTTYPSMILLDLLSRNKISVVLDVGANEGQYGKELRKAGYRGKIISFEPLEEAYRNLQIHAQNDKNWKTWKYALGEANGNSVIHVSGHSPSSSLLPMTAIHREASPGSEYIYDEEIEIKTLDSIIDSLGIANESIFLKVDTQGYEKRVLQGSARSLSLISGIQLELSATTVYEGEELYYTVCRFAEDSGFRLVRIIPGYTNKKTGEMLQFDAIFFRHLS
jgi:FkbM family methyltransferase